MGAFGDLAPFGLLTFGDAETDAERIYATLQAGTAAAFDTSEGTHIEASNFARAIAFACARATFRHGANQRLPQYVVEAIDDLEKLYGTVPSGASTMIGRRAALVAKRAIQRGSRPEALDVALTALLGSAYWKTRRVQPLEISATPTPGARGAWADPAAPRRYWKLDRSVPVTGIPFAVGISAISEDAAEMPKAGDALCVQPENFGLAEQITITAVDPVARTITATFANAHDGGASLVTHAPVCASNQRTLLAAVTPAAAANVTTLRKTLDLLFRIVRGVTRPYVVASADGVTAGPFTVDLSHVDVTPIGTVTL